MVVRRVVGCVVKVDVTVPMRHICSDLSFRDLFEFLMVAFNHTDDLGVFKYNVVFLDARFLHKFF